VNRLPTLADLRGGQHLLRHVPGFVRRSIGHEDAVAVVRRRLGARGADFLALARAAIYSRPAELSPYRRLLDDAGCELGDLERLVHREGLEGALHALYRRGVYLTVDECKGRRAVTRGSTTFTVRADQLHNPLARVDAVVATGGSRGARTPLPLSLEHLRDRAIDHRVDFDLKMPARRQMAVCGVPGGAMMNGLLMWSIIGQRPVRWFTPVALTEAGLHPRYVWSHRVLRWAARLGGVSLPAPEHVPLDDMLPIARWMAPLAQRGQSPVVYSYPTVAVRISQAATQAGLDLSGGWLPCAGEPITAARVATVQRTGARVIPMYASMETGLIATGCPDPRQPDDHHLVSDLHAVIQPGPEVEGTGLTPRALLLTSLRATAGLLLLNVSLGDEAHVQRTACGCRLEQLGWTTGLHTVRSFEKLTAGGMTFYDVDVIRVLEEVLPARFGGGPTDYQLLELEDASGHPRLQLLVHPRVGPLDTSLVVNAFLEGIGGGSGADHLMGLVWRDGRFVGVECRATLATPVGKILHLHRGVTAR
jgi:hypothetical protein